MLSVDPAARCVCNMSVSLFMSVALGIPFCLYVGTLVFGGRIQVVALRSYSTLPTRSGIVGLVVCFSVLLFRG